MLINCANGGSRAEARRRRIMDAARKLFVGNGFHATGIAQIARESGVAVGQIYRDFSAKEDIVAALVHTGCVQLMRFELLEGAIRVRDTAAVREWLRDFIEPGKDMDDARLFAEIVAESSRNPRMAAIYLDVQDQLRSHILAALALLVPGDALATRRAVMADAVMSVSVGLLVQRLIRADFGGDDLIASLDATLEREIASLTAG